ncbi:50S ribosomal protein L29 [Candidatus Parcubacteria bacterium]|nr:50S ribosomal protein L29 [Candidatus Parcubacteria bacterium]
MKKTTYIGKAKDELVKSLYEKREALRQFRFGLAGSKTRNVKEGANLRKEISRIMTELNRTEVRSKK